MPTTRKRHSITETADLERALEPLRTRGIRIDFPDLIIKGAEVALEEAQVKKQSEAKREQGRKRFLDRIESGGGIDIDAALSVRETGWLHRIPPE